jgi:hypothetical protein
VQELEGLESLNKAVIFIVHDVGTEVVDINTNVEREDAESG